MPQEVGFEKATLQEITWSGSQVVEGDRTVTVQFNPETLKLSFSNQNAGGDQRGGSATQFLGNGVTKLSFDLWFDITVRDDVNDVRKLTKEVALFMAPEGGANDDAPPGVRFLWGNFLFEGVMDSLSENLDFFSEDGYPLRASMSVALSKQEINFKFGEELNPNAAAADRASPDRPLAPVREGDTAQSVAARDGRPDAWPDYAEANGVENPRQPAPPGGFLRRPGR